MHPSDELYGADRCLLDIIVGLPADFRAVVVLPTDMNYSGTLSAELARIDAQVERVDMLVLRRSLLRFGHLFHLTKRLLLGTWSLAKLCRQYDVQIVHSNTIAVQNGVIAAAMTSTPHVWHIHEYIGDEPALFRRLLRFALSTFPGRIVANSKATARAIVDGNKRSASKTTVIYNGVQITSGQRTPRKTQSGATAITHICVIGRLTLRKGIVETLQAIGILVNRGYRLQLSFIGDVPPGQQDLRLKFERLAFEQGIEHSISFCGEQRDTNLILRSSDILLAPSQRPEGFGLTIIEAMANGVPVVAVRNGGGSDELMQHMHTGIYCGRDPQSIADGLEQLLCDQTLRSGLADNAYAEVQRRFSLDRYQRQFIHLYRRMG